MERCSELVMRLNGAEATDGMFDLVFGRNQGKHLHPPTLPPPSLSLSRSTRLSVDVKFVELTHRYFAQQSCPLNIPPATTQTSHAPK